jgi:hypothetical protein
MVGPSWVHAATTANTNTREAGSSDSPGEAIDDLASGTLNSIWKQAQLKGTQ